MAFGGKHDRTWYRLDRYWPQPSECRPSACIWRSERAADIRGHIPGTRMAACNIEAHTWVREHTEVHMKEHMKGTDTDAVGNAVEREYPT